MFIYQLVPKLSELVGKTDIAWRPRTDISERLECLGGYNLVPAGISKNSRHLEIREIVACLLSLASARPGHAGLAAIILMKLRPVGGARVSLMQSETFALALEELLTNSSALDALVEVRISCSEFYTNSFGRASVVFRAGERVQTCHYVHDTALSLLQDGADVTYDPRSLASSVIQETVLLPKFFMSIVSFLKRFSRSLPLPPTDDEIDKDAKERERAKRLGLTSSSDFLNVAVDTQVTWPNTEVVEEFNGVRLVLMPMT